MRQIRTEAGVDVPRSSSQRSASVFHSDSGCIELLGKDAADLLQRISTNDVLKTGEGSFCETVLTNEKGRIVEVLTVLRVDGRLLALPASHESGNAKEWMERFIITEDVIVKTHEQPVLLVQCIGADAGRFTAEFLGADAPSGARVASVHRADGVVRAWQNPAWHGVDCFSILVEHPDGNPSIPELSRSGGMSSEEFERVRILEGIPAMGAELTLDVNPLEAGLQRCISFTKGCYIGQEVIARLDSYNKLQRRIGAFELLSKTAVLPGRIFAEGEEAGWTTSHCSDERGRRQYALGYLRISAEGKPLSVVDEAGQVCCELVRRDLAGQAV